MEDSSKKWFSLALISTGLATLVHGYLTFRHFELNFAPTLNDSLCNINATFNCDAVAASSFSKFLGIPLALWGAVTNLVVLLMAFFYRMIETDENDVFGKILYFLGALVGITSIVMIGISVTKLSVYCPFCIAAYVLSFGTWMGLHFSLPHRLSSLPSAISQLFGAKKGALIMLLAIPVGTWFLNGILHTNYKADQKQMAKMVKYQVEAWKTAAAHDFSSLGGLELGASAEKAKMTIVEFADFLCGHCKSAAPKLHAFTKAHEDVRLVFLTFPLDADCNPALERSNGVRCRLAKATFCAKEKAWDVHDYIFARQNEWSRLTSVNEPLEKMASDLGMDWGSLSSCIESEEMHEKVTNQARKGNNSGVRGTPAIFVNGKLLPGGQMLQILEAAYKEL